VKEGMRAGGPRTQAIPRKVRAARKKVNFAKATVTGILSSALRLFLAEVDRHGKKVDFAKPWLTGNC
jgi:hypothetical protein